MPESLRQRLCDYFYRWVSNGSESKAPPALTAVENIGKYNIINCFYGNCLVL
jgi:hypothetical protein